MHATKKQHTRIAGMSGNLPQRNMAKRSTHTIGLDIGTSRVTCVVAAPGEDGLLSIVGTGESESRGLRKGVIVNRKQPSNRFGARLKKRNA